MREVNVAVIGAGYWGKKVVYEYVQLARKRPDVKLLAVCDLLDENLEYCRRRFGVPCLTKDYKEVLLNHEINAVDICTPNETHFEICKAALEAGKHVLLEKPMTLDPKQAHELVDLARSKNLVLSVGHIYRFNNALKKIRSLIRQNFFGDIFHLRLQWTTYVPPLRNRDVLTDLMPHPFDILNFLLDSWPSRITCRAKAYRRKELEEIAYVLAEFPSGVMGHIEISWLLPGKVREVSVMGSEKFARIDCLNQRISVYDNDNGNFFDLEVKANNTIESELFHFIDCVQNGLDPINGCEKGAKIVEMVEFARRSLKEGRTVETNRCNTYNIKDPVKGAAYSIIKNVEIEEGTTVQDQVNLYKCKIGKNCKIEAYVYIEEGVTIGDNCKVKPFVYIPTGVTIEDDVFIGPNVTFTNDKYPRVKGGWKLLPTKVRKGASIGANSIILPGVVVGENALVGAGSVVTKDVPDNAIVVGNPARIIGFAKAYAKEPRASES